MAWNRLYLAAGFAVSLLAASPSVSTAQAPKRVTVEYQGARLGDVVRALASFSGRVIILPPNVSELRIDASFDNVEWKAALDSILASQALVAREDAAGVLHVERKG